jgi:hypothetical protein
MYKLSSWKKNLQMELEHETRVDLIYSQGGPQSITTWAKSTFKNIAVMFDLSTNDLPIAENSLPDAMKQHFFHLRSDRFQKLFSIPEVFSTCLSHLDNPFCVNYAVMLYPIPKPTGQLGTLACHSGVI